MKEFLELKGSHNEPYTFTIYDISDNLWSNISAVYIVISANLDFSDWELIYIGETDNMQKVFDSTLMFMKNKANYIGIMQWGGFKERKYVVEDLKLKHKPTIDKI